MAGGGEESGAFCMNHGSVWDSGGWWICANGKNGTTEDEYVEKKEEEEEEDKEDKEVSVEEMQ